MTVYLVSIGEYDYEILWGVYSTLDKAVAFLDEWSKRPGADVRSSDWPVDIGQAEVDGEIKWLFTCPGPGSPLADHKTGIPLEQQIV